MNSNVPASDPKNGCKSSERLTAPDPDRSTEESKVDPGNAPVESAQSSVEDEKNESGSSRGAAGVGAGLADDAAAGGG